MATFSPRTHMDFSLCMHTPGVSSSYYMDLSPLGWWTHLTLIISLNSPCVQKQSCLWLGLQHMNWWGTGAHSAVDNNYEKCFCRTRGLKKKGSLVSQRITNSSQDEVLEKSLSEKVMFHLVLHHKSPQNLAAWNMVILLSLMILRLD